MTSTQTDDLNDLAVENLTGRVAALERELRELRARPEPEAGWPQYLSRGLFEPGAALHSEFLEAERRLADARAEHRDLDRRWEAIAATLRGGKYGDGVHPHPDEKRLRAAQTQLAAQLPEAWGKVKSAQAERDRIAERLVREFASVEVVPTRLPSGEDGK